MVETKNSITSILSAYERQEKRRALGGIYALAGFDYQLRFYLADLVESLVNSASNLNLAGQVYLEALSDVTKQSEDSNLICIQVKRTLTTETIKDAAFEVVAIDRFLNSLYPSMSKQVKFNLVASQGSPDIDWAGIPKTHETHSTISQLLAQGRLLAPRIEPDPWWRAITAVWPHIKDPYGFLRFALERAISRGPTAADAKRIRDDICERFKQDKLVKDLSGQLLESADFQLKAKPSIHLDVGREITLARLRDSQYLGLTHRLNVLCTHLFEYKDTSQRKCRNEVPVFWLTGRSGAGKSVQLLQTLERLVLEGWRVLWLKGNAELLEPTLRAIKEAHEQDRPDFIAIDDLYDRDARNRIDLSRLGEFIDESDHHSWPIILTCGPTEFAESFEVDATYRGFNLERYPISPLAAQEAEEIEAWYQQRTGKSALRGSAYTQAAEDDNGLFISLALELAHGDIKTFAQRFAQRIELNILNKALVLPLALNRLYLRAPYDWLTIEDRETLATLNHEGDFNFLETAEEGKIIRLTHPHLADALYLALRKPANKEAYTNDLANVFQRALTEQNAGLVSQLLRLFSGREQGIAIERLSIVNLPDLAMKCARLWHENPSKISDADGLADMLTSWACWASTTPNLVSVLSTNVLTTALGSLEYAYKIWSICWQHLSRYYPSDEKLFSWAAIHLSEQLFISHPTWSYVWEYCLENDTSRTRIWYEMGLDWLQRSLRRPDWHIVWKKLLAEDKPDGEQTPILILGHRRLHAESDGPDWAFVLQDLLRLAEPGSTTSYKLFDLSHKWLTGHEDRVEWVHVWRALLEQQDALPASLPLSELLERGAAWLTGREERAEWVHVWRALLEQRDALPASLPLSELLERGAAWLTGREERAEWTYVWRELLGQRDALPASLPLSELLERGAAWLTGRKERAEWTYVWQELLGQRDALPASLRLSELLERGEAWLTGREERAEWAHVWRELLGQRDALPASLRLSELLERGEAWLTGREERAEWAHVWRELLGQRDALPASLPLSELLDRGAAWLTGREERAEWTYVWQELLGQRDALPASLRLSELLERGAAWLTGREERAEWAYVWQELLGQRDALPASLRLSELLERGATWMKLREDNVEESSFVLERLLEQQYQDELFLDNAANWLTQTSKKPEWPILSAKFIMAAPQHDVSKKMAVMLAERIQAEPNKHHWLKTESLTADLTAKKALPLEVKGWLRALHTRKEHPAWAEVRRSFNEGLPLKGRISVRKNSSSSSIGLENGLEAFCSDSGLTKSRTYDFYVLNLNLDKGTINVGINKKIPLKIGEKYSGLVVRYMEYGAFITIDGQSGLLHKTECSNWEALVKKFPKGSKICVKVLNVALKGAKLQYSGPELTPEFTVGEVYKGSIRGMKEYGLFLRLGTRDGLLHRTKMLPNTDIMQLYSIGGQLDVQLIEIKDNGKLVFKLPD